MIKYSLRCDHDHVFEGWFRNNDDCEAQIRDGRVECPYCASTSIAKSLMAPSVTGTRTQDKGLPVRPGAAHTGVASGGAGGNAVVPASVSVSAPASAEAGEGPSPQQIQQMLRAFRQHVVDNADYVGDKFAEEARKMHFRETEERGIYGEATVDEIKSLSEDGIDCLPMPVLPEDQN
ncbi:DUF1178 family protein [Cohaesibacter haloalkalitolerans]|uniref:DUF1178 family protein n=1 Tax=Cohaesibacter haloalkalitolerans TaxID=1162980 RepID=UPI000E6582C9|nr:DUF1178 family protein [Cohaesibacter haloalkalitolerans]